MIKIAIISDIHANLPALKAVIQNARKAGAMMIWNLGDNCGYGPYPNEILKLICAECEYNLQGNYDKKVLKYAGLKKNIPAKTNNDKKSAFIWAWNELTEANRNLINELPNEIFTFLSSYRVMLVHGSPESENEGIDENTPIKRLKELFTFSKSDIILCGHTHKQFFTKIGKRFVINPGSVGRPDDGDPRAAYSMLTIDDEDNIGIEMHRIEYNTDVIIDAINSKGLPTSFISMFTQGRPFHLINTMTIIVPIEELLQAINSYLYDINADLNHPIQVASLAKKIFRQLFPLHNLDENAENILIFAAMLHDIGWTTGINSHHKRSADLIRNSNLPFTSIERELTAQIARYHRKSTPSLNHKSFSMLSYEDKQRIKILSSILRIADGLDNNHEQKTTDIICKITRKNILIQLISEKDPLENINAAIKKSDYMVELLGRTITFKWKKENK